MSEAKWMINPSGEFLRLHCAPHQHVLDCDGLGCRPATQAEIDAMIVELGGAPIGKVDAHCDLCRGTGWMGDKGPGIAGNSEWHPCDRCYPGLKLPPWPPNVVVVPVGMVKELADALDSARSILREAKIPVYLAEHWDNLIAKARSATEGKA